MSQVGKLYQFYFKKIGTKNWLRIIIFTLLISVVWWFVIPGAAKAEIKKIEEGQKRVTREENRKEERSFSQSSRLSFGGEGRDIERKVVRELLEDESKGKAFLREKRISEDSWETNIIRWSLRAVDESSFIGMTFPYISDNAFFFQQTEGYNNLKEKPFGKMLFNISGGNLSGVIILYGFIFEVFDKTFFPSRREGEEATVLTVTPSVKRSDIIGGKILAFLTFYFLINIILFLVPFGIYYFGLGEVNFAWFALLALITIIVGPLLYFGLVFAPYLFFGSLTGQRGIFMTLVSFFPGIWGGIKIISSASGLRTLETTFFDPLGFTIISLVCGIFFLTLYYLRYQEEDLA